MFQLKRWNKAVVHREGRDLNIVVSRPRSLADWVGLAVIALPWPCFIVAFVIVPMFHATSAMDLLMDTCLSLGLVVPLFLFFRALGEKECDDQIVTISAGELEGSQDIFMDAEAACKSQRNHARLNHD
ncbi:MAG TPA: hypothetical protein VEV37_08970 [Bryobacteraceae bacterium]|nr:hypothetical protein [Bryobacteraceae bacterium]